VVGYLGLLLGLIVIAFLAFDPAAILGLFGKDTSISGRGPIWEEALAAIKERPFFGYGYASFWLPDSIVTRYIWSRVKWNAPSAHNGFLELALDIGIVGLTFYMYMIGRLVILTIRAIRLGGAPEARWLSLFLIAMLIENFDEGTLAWPDLMASTVAFGSAMTDSWWRKYRQNRSETKPPTRFPTWAEQFAGSSVAARPADHLA
jgi:O-antigen ligase